MFKLASKFKPTGDQPQAIEKLTRGILAGEKHQTLLGVTGSGKTFAIANVIANIQKPTLIISPNKTLAAQLYQEFKDFFPQNSVHYFVSFYDYYQPEAYIPHTDTYIEKDARINEELDKLRHAATQAIISRNDVIIVASVSCIYNLGSPEDYENLSSDVFENQEITDREIFNNLLRLQYKQDIELKRGTFRKSRDEFEIIPSTGNAAVKIKTNNKRVFKIFIAENVDLENIIVKPPSYQRVVETKIFPAKYWITDNDRIGIAIDNIRAELQQQTRKLKKNGMAEEASRLKEKTEFDIEMLKQTGYCYGIENYSRHLDHRLAGQPPYTLINFFRKKGEFLTIIDESHISVPQLNGMHSGDHSRKSTLIKHGFRLPSALDNRPLRFREFEKLIGQTIYTSATPGKYEIRKSGGKRTVEQLVRPTGLVDPTIEVRKTKDQIEHLVQEIQKRIENKQRILVTTLTKRMAEDLTEYLSEKNIKVNYIHSDVKTLDRVEVIGNLRRGVYDVIVGVNLLREGLDLPEVSLIAILDADKEGFLRNPTTLIQTIGRAARNIDGHVIMYADKITKSMKTAIDETNRRRKIQEKYNIKNGITPTTIQKAIVKYDLPSGKSALFTRFGNGNGFIKKKNALEEIQEEIEKAIKRLEFEKALFLREQLNELKEKARE